MDKELRQFVKDTSIIMVMAFILVLVLRNYVVEGRVVLSESMYPTIKIGDRLMVNKYIYRFEEPKRGDIVVFKPPAEINSKDDFVKRIIGLPGDKIEIKAGFVLVNSQLLDEPYVHELPDYNYGPVTVPPDRLFVMGDNRNKSFDSHLWNGWLPRGNLIGKAFAIYWPTDRMVWLSSKTNVK